MSIVSIYHHYHEEVHWFMTGAAFDTVSMTHSMLERQWSKTWRGADEEGSNSAAQGNQPKGWGHVRHGPRQRHKKYNESQRLKKIVPNISLFPSTWG